MTFMTFSEPKVPVLALLPASTLLAVYPKQPTNIGLGNLQLQGPLRDRCSFACTELITLEGKIAATPG